MVLDGIETQHLVKLLTPIWTTKTETAMKGNAFRPSSIQRSKSYTPQNPPLMMRGPATCSQDACRRSLRSIIIRSMPTKTFLAFVADLTATEALCSP